MTVCACVRVCECVCIPSHRIQHLEDLVLLTGVQAVDDDRQARLVLGEAVDRLGHPRHQLHLVLQHLGRRKGAIRYDLSMTSGFISCQVCIMSYPLQFVVYPISSPS